MLLADFGYTVAEPKFFDRKKYNATSIRQLIADGGQWEELVPSAISEYIKKINGVKRIQTIFKSETNPREF